MVKAHTANQLMTDLLLVNGSLPLDILRPLSNRFNKETSAVIIIKELILHLDEGFSRRCGVHRVVLILHLNIDSMHYAAVGQRNTIGIFKDNVPAALFAVIGNMALVDIVEYSLVKIAYIIVVGLITLTENLVADDLLP